MRIVIVFLLLVPSLLSIGQTAPTTKFHSMLESYFQEYLELNPSVATSLGDYRYNDKLENNLSQTYRTKTQNMYRRYLDSLKAYNPQKLSARDQLSYKIFKYDLERGLERAKYPTHLTPISQMGDFRLSFSQLGGGTGNHPFKTMKDFEDFIKRMDAFSAITDTAIANMRKGIAAKRVLPTIVVQKVIPQVKAMLVDSIPSSLFYNPIKNIPASITSTDKERITQAYTNAIKQKILPAYQRLHTFLEKEYLPKTREKVGLLALDGGNEGYAFLVKSYTTTDLTPAEVFAIGEKEVKRIHAEMEQVKQQVGFIGDLKAFLKYALEDKKFYPFKEDEEVVAAYNQVYDRIKPHISKLFNMVPKTAFEIRPVEKYRAAATAAHYMRGTVDGSRPGIFYFPVADAKKYHYWRMEDLFLHEAIPGHHYQISLQIENPDIPGFQKTGAYGAYVEGWGLYAERLGSELGLYTDPYQRLGQLYGEIHRAIRLVVDAGIHYKGWTREQAIQYSLDNEPITEANAIQEIERYIVMPGQALSYKIGELKILEMRQKAEKELGNKFDVRAFHDEVLKDGAMPLQIFEAKMNSWIERSK
ncbi:DUF885 domain-containing protein [Aridibaculum aurantiacum]|uniref:DUF885 domain-containing protein n=1 Tax=Aridibaculum aurantiacum TaxID=2810307 RepID=UPI001A97277E|nr:DUF885 domain-containing protein [Aridibaculum aurantiacum]